MLSVFFRAIGFITDGSCFVKTEGGNQSLCPSTFHFTGALSISLAAGKRLWCQGFCWVFFFFPILPDTEDDARHLDLDYLAPGHERDHNV